MAVVQYRSRSPYSRTKQTSWHLDYYEPRIIAPAEDDTEIVVDPRYEFRPYLLSYDLYQTPQWFWVFAARNMDLIHDLIYDLKGGMEIIVPSKTHLDRLR